MTSTVCFEPEDPIIVMFLFALLKLSDLLQTSVCSVTRTTSYHEDTVNEIEREVLAGWLVAPDAMFDQSSTPEGHACSR
jgi:hypothetical protein